MRQDKKAELREMLEAIRAADEIERNPEIKKMADERDELDKKVRT